MGFKCKKVPVEQKMEKGPSGTKMEKGPSRTKIVEQKLSGYKRECLVDFCSFDVWTLKG